jgi:hypothetical protein
MESVATHPRSTKPKWALTLLRILILVNLFSPLWEAFFLMVLGFELRYAC